jgi:processing peptidase subunit beta
MMAAKLVNSLKPYQLKVFKNVTYRLQSTVEQALAATPETQESSIANGLRIASKDTGGDVCTVGLWIDAGSRCETPANNGVSHFVEHMIFKGTHNRTQAQLEHQIEGMGAQFGAHTSREQIAYYAKCLKKDVPAVVEILSDAVQNPLFNEEAMEKERGVILGEMEESSGDLETVLMDYLHATAYQGTALGLSVFGTSANVQSLSSADLHDYVSANFTAPRIALAAAGGIDHSALVGLAEANLGGLSGAVHGGVTACRFTGSSIDDRNDDLPFNHVAIAVQGPGWTSDDHLPLMVAKSIVGSWSKGMAGAANVFGFLGPRAMKTMEAYNGFSSTYTETSLFGVQLVSNAVDLDDAMECVTRELVRLCGDITDSDVARAKAALQTNLLLQQDDTSGVCANIGQHMLAHGRHISALDVCQSIDAISTQEVKDVCMKYIYDKCPAVASVGPTEGVQDYNIVRSRLYWMRF